jgi:hypothetical protein
MDIAVDKKVPMPEHPRREAGAKYPWRQMKVGDSFLFPADIKIGKAAALATGFGKAIKGKFSCRTTDEGVRCWRVE